jgi:Trypsin-like peptidase domain/Tetratricopeptide repeat
MHKNFFPALLGFRIAISSIWIAPVVAAIPTPITNVTDRVVAIETRTSQGSGVTIEHVGNTYTILTAAHVVKDLRGSSLTITTPDLQKYLVNPQDVKIAPNAIDLATITFQSDLTYAVAKLGNADAIARGQQIFVAGFQGKSLKFYPGTVVAIGRYQSHDRGYGLAIGTAELLPGMSGGGLFNEIGSLIGINGISIGDPIPNSQEEGRERVKPLSGLAIPIDTFNKVAERLNVKSDSGSPISGSSTPVADDFFINAQEKTQQGNYQGAIADYDRVLALNPRFDEVYFRRGIARSLAKDWQAAAADFTSAIAIYPNYLEAYLHRGSIRNILTDWQGAKSDFDLALSLEPNSSSAYMGRGVALCELRDCQRGVEDYDRAISLNPTADAYTHRAFARYRSGNTQGAIADYLAAAELYRQQGNDREYLETVKKIKQLVRG